MCLLQPAYAQYPKPPEVGIKALDFELPIAGDDGSLKLSERYADGPVVLIVLRGFPGYQCGMCSQQVSSLLNRAKTFEKNAKSVILVYPGEDDSLEKRADEFMRGRRLPAPFVMVRDPGMKMVSDWGLRWNAPRETAYPSTFIINQDGEIAWKKVSTSHGGRTTADEILKAIKKTSGR